MAIIELERPHLFRVFFKINILATNNPKKKDHRGIGCSMISQSIVKDKLKMAVMIPKKRTI